jgi:hypothetical protein
MTNEIKDDRNPKRKPLLVVIYLILILCIGFLLWKKFYVKKTGIELKYGETPTGLLTVVDNTFHTQPNRKVSLIFIFNQLPVLPDIENINKIFTKHKNNTQLFVLFHKKFKATFDFKFPHKFVPNSSTEGHYMGSNYDSKYFILLEDKKVKHVDTSMNAVDLNFLIEKHLYPEKNYESYVISKEQIQEKIIKELKAGDVELLNVNDAQHKTLRDFKEFEKIYVVIAKCSSCELKTLVSDLKLRQVLDSGNTLVVFPIYANESQLMEILDKENVNLPLYLDYNDRFGLFSIITSPKDKFIIIENKDITGLEHKEAPI